MWYHNDEKQFSFHQVIKAITYPDPKRKYLLRNNFLAYTQFVGLTMSRNSFTLVNIIKIKIIILLS